jgi:hypothetical protein
VKRKKHYKEKPPDGIVFRNNDKGWITEELMVEWLREYCQKTMCCSHEKKGEILLLDALQCHITAEVKTTTCSN